MPLKEAWPYDVLFPRSQSGQTDRHKHTHTWSTSINIIDRWDVWTCKIACHEISSAQALVYNPITGKPGVTSYEQFAVRKLCTVHCF